MLGDEGMKDCGIRSEFAAFECLQRSGHGELRIGERETYSFFAEIEPKQPLPGLKACAKFFQVDHTHDLPPLWGQVSRSDGRGAGSKTRVHRRGTPPSRITLVMHTPPQGGRENRD